MISATVRRRVAALAAAATVAALLAGCTAASANTNDEGAGGGSVELPRISTVVSYPALPSGLEQGLFDDAFGTDASDIQIDYVASGPDGVQALVGGHADIVLGGYDPGAVAGTDVRVLAITETSPDTHAILVKPGSDISSIDDLEGKTIGGYGTTPPAFLLLLLDREGLDESFFNYIQVPNDGGLSALTSGAIDAWYTWDPFFAQAELQGLAEPIVAGEDFYLNPIVLLTTQSYLDEHEDSLAAFIDGYIASTDWVNENPEAARDYMADATGMTKEAAEITIARRHYEVVVPDEAAIEWMQHLAQLQVDAGLITAAPDLDTLIDSATVEQGLANAGK